MTDSILFRMKETSKATCFEITWYQSPHL